MLIGGIGFLYGFGFLFFPDSEHLRATLRTYTLSGRLAIFHGDTLWILDLNLLATFHAICFHR